MASQTVGGCPRCPSLCCAPMSPSSLARIGKLPLRCTDNTVQTSQARRWVLDGPSDSGTHDTSRPSLHCPTRQNDRAFRPVLDTGRPLLGIPLPGASRRGGTGAPEAGWGFRADRRKRRDGHPSAWLVSRCPTLSLLLSERSCSSHHENALGEGRGSRQEKPPPERAANLDSRYGWPAGSIGIWVLPLVARFLTHLTKGHDVDPAWGRELCALLIPGSGRLARRPTCRVLPVCTRCAAFIRRLVNLRGG